MTKFLIFFFYNAYRSSGFVCVGPWKEKYGNYPNFKHFFAFLTIFFIVFFSRLFLPFFKPANTTFRLKVFDEMWRQYLFSSLDMNDNVYQFITEKNSHSNKSRWMAIFFQSI